MSRPSWDETWMEIARTIARRSVCSRAQVGAVIVSSENRVLATGYNGPPATYVDPGRERVGRRSCDQWCQRGMAGPTPQTVKSYEDCPTIHAEMNALMHSDRSSREGGTIYVTGVLCLTCTKAVANSGLARIVIFEEVEDRSHRAPDLSLELLGMCGITVGTVA